MTGGRVGKLALVGDCERSPHWRRRARFAAIGRRAKEGSLFLRIEIKITRKTRAPGAETTGQPHPAAALFHRPVVQGSPRTDCCWRRAPDCGGGAKNAEKRRKPKSERAKKTLSDDPPVQWGEAAVNIENGLWFVLRGPHAIACASVTNAPPSRVVASPRATRGASSAAAAAGVSVGGGRRQKRPMPKILGGSRADGGANRQASCRRQKILLPARSQNFFSACATD